MNAIIIYDEFDSAVRAKARLENAGFRVDEAVQWNVKPWRLDLLELSPAAEEALTEAADAHLIVFALKQLEFLPSCLPEWLERWAERRQVQEAVLAVWDCGKGRLRPAPATRELSQMARRHGLNLVLDEAGPVGKKNAGIMQNLREREVFPAPTLEQIMEPPVHGDFPRWA